MCSPAVTAVSYMPWIPLLSNTTGAVHKSLFIIFIADWIDCQLLGSEYFLCSVSIEVWIELEILREHKPPPIQRIRISDFGLPDPKHDPDRDQNCITLSLSHALPLQKISSKSIHKFASNPMDSQINRQTNRQTDKQTNWQTDRTKNIRSFFGGGNHSYAQKGHILA